MPGQRPSLGYIRSALFAALAGVAGECSGELHLRIHGFAMHRAGQRNRVGNRRRHSLTGEGQKGMRGIANQNQVAAIKMRDQVGIHGAPKIHAREVGNGEQMWNGRCPTSYQGFYESPLGFGSGAAVLPGRRESPRVKLQIPDQMFAVYWQNTQSDAAAGGMEFVEIAACPTNGVFTTR